MLHGYIFSISVARVCAQFHIWEHSKEQKKLSRIHEETSKNLFQQAACCTRPFETNPILLLLQITIITMGLLICRVDYGQQSLVEPKIVCHASLVISSTEPVIKNIRCWWPPALYNHSLLKIGSGNGFFLKNAPQFWGEFDRKESQMQVKRRICQAPPGNWTWDLFTCIWILRWLWIFWVMYLVAGHAHALGMLCTPGSNLV